MIDVVVIGAGIIGATVAQAMRKEGREVLLLDNETSHAGTRASGGHLKPSWFSGMKKEQYEPAMELLSDVWGMTEEPFLVKHTGLSTSVFRVDTDKVTKVEKELSAVHNIGHWDNYPAVYHDINGTTETRCRLLVIAAGVWCNELLLPQDQFKIDSKQGVSFRLQGKIKQAFINPWAPYKQIVAHQQSENEIWIGDGSAILSTNWTEERTAQCRERCLNQAPGCKVKRTIMGYRPYCRAANVGDPCYLKKIRPRVWVATGAGKSGTIAAGWVARQILDRTE